MSQQTLALSQTEKNKMQMLRQLKQLKKDIKENAKVCANMAKTLRDIIEDKAKAAEAWEKRRQKKLAAGKKVNIVFVCSRPACWASLKTTCQAFIDDPRCDVKIVAIPEREPQPNSIYNHNIFSDLGAYEHLSKTMPCRVIDGYNKQTRVWFDLEKLNPDYVFLQTPYNALYAPQYGSNKVSSYAKVCYIGYGTMLFKGLIEQVAHPVDFFFDVAFHFYESKLHTEFYNAYYNSIGQYCKTKYIATGFAKFDEIKQYADTKSPLWNERKENTFRVLWTPRWTTIGNDSHFLDYKSNFLELCDRDPDIDFILRPHPLTFRDMVASGNMTQQELDDYIAEYDIRKNAGIDRRPVYIDTFFSSDVLVTDISSVIPEYLATGKPVIYCHKTNNFNEAGTILSEAFYWAHSWGEVVKYLNMLKNNEDPLREKRRTVLSGVYEMSEKGTGSDIKEHILSDYFFAEKLMESA